MFSLFSCSMGDVTEQKFAWGCKKWRNRRREEHFGGEVIIIMLRRDAKYLRVNA